MKSLLRGWAITTVAVLVAAEIVPGIHWSHPVGLVLATLVLGILNVVVRPILVVLSLPFMILSFGLFLLVINGFLLWLVGHMEHFKVDGFVPAFFGALIISLVSMVLNRLLPNPPTPRPPRRPPPPPADTGSGPVIDV